MPSCSGLIERVGLAVLEQLPAAYGCIGRTVKWGQHPAGVKTQPAHLWMVIMLAHADGMPVLDPPAVHPT